MKLYLPYYHPEAIGPPWHIFNVSTSNGRAYIVSRNDQDSASEAQEHIYTYIKSTHIKFHEGVLLCLGAMAILVSKGRHKNHQNVDFFANQCI